MLEYKKALSNVTNKKNVMRIFSVYFKIYKCQLGNDSF